MDNRNMRAGNQVYYNGVCEVFYIGEEYTNVTHHNDGDLTVLTENIKPIPLDKDWLLRFKFEKYPIHDEYYTIAETATGPKLIEYNLEDGSLFLNSDKIEVINVSSVNEMQNALWVLNNFIDVKLN